MRVESSGATGAVPLKDPPGVLGTIVERTLRDLDPRAIAALPPRRAAVRPFAAALSGPGLALIAEYKPRSPSRGAIRPDATPEAIARSYRPHAAAISCLVDGPHFGGSYAALRRVRAAAHQPVLAKGFFVSEIQVREAHRMGADAILLMASLLPPVSLKRLLALATDLGLGALVEVHDPIELAEALSTDAAVIGVNSRDLTTLGIDLDRARRLLADVPSDRIRVAESGLDTPAAVDGVRSLADGVLVGTALMKAPDPARAIVDLGLSRRPRVKICGLRTPADALAAAGADLVGINRCSGFRRCVAPAEARAIIDALGEVTPVAVYMDRTPSDTLADADAIGAAMVQLHGRESLADCAAVAAHRPVIKALTVDTLDRAEDYAPHVTAFLIDGRAPGAGRRWDLAPLEARLRHGRLAGRPVFVAGGLRPENVADVIAAVGPAGVDVASGVERGGAIAFDRIHAFAAAARGPRE